MLSAMQCCAAEVEVCVDSVGPARCSLKFFWLQVLFGFEFARIA